MPSDPKLTHGPTLAASATCRLRAASAHRRAPRRPTGSPRQPRGVSFAQFAGYVNVDRKHGRKLFYYFVESPYDAASKSLILWLNGGPGCSSLGFGAMEELGPFRVNRDGKTLSRNSTLGTTVMANMIFLESPAGVGFSYSMNSSNYSDAGDQRTAEDTYVFLVNWLRFPEYKGRDFYIAGESYGGHYVPQVATIITFVNHLFDETPFNLRGIFVGNPLLDDYKNDEGFLEFLWSHGVISDEVWAKILANCTFTSSDDWPCFVAVHSFQHRSLQHLRSGLPLQRWNPSIQQPITCYDPCIDFYIPRYLDNPDVKKALHARLTRSGQCRIEIGLGGFPGFRGANHQKAGGRWIKRMDLQVGGYVQQYEGGFTLASVRGAGHLVPSFQPKRSLVLLYSFLKGMLPPADIPK
ncbi:hypothetical protein E2562_021922 [Oryza meyeriana var. granulata]|uniref:Carboxypeptidase n=1 Tax=Oryza meyeriana var. granulata TaxID=110450 RepID=A0A6G1DLB8_9ORYZ|nr:hypothetical protein E2562_021922 [Oryza meyeriana var. granulata]